MILKVTPKVIILVGPGTNCDEETLFSLRYLGAEPYVYLLREIKKNPKKIHDFGAIVIPGGFSYGDYVAAGRMFAREMELFLGKELERFLKKGGFILGICNGFQILVSSLLLPGLKEWFLPPRVSLISNDSMQYEDRWVFLRVEKKDVFWFKGLPSVIELPVAHAEGKFFAPKTTIQALKRNKQIALRYVMPDGTYAKYPYNPNGSLEGIAAITDKTGQILGMMPHPERFFFSEQNPLRDSIYPWGRKIFANLIKEIKRI